jgi:HlyD family secretion protein
MKKIFTNRKFKIVGIVLIIALLGIFKLTRPPKPVYTTTNVARGSLSQVVSASGKITSEKIAQLAFQTSGKLNWIGVKEQDSVKQWQAIASLDTKSVQENIKKELLAYMNQRWSFEQTQANYKSVKDNFTITDAEKRILQESQFNLDSSIADVEIADLAKQNATLFSPINGVVVQIVTPVAGVNVTAGINLFTIVDPNSVYFQAQVDELDIGKIFLGQKVKINLDAYPNEIFEGMVTKIGFAAIGTSGGGTAFPVSISLPVNDQLKFKIGLNGDSEMIFKEENNVLLVPNTAIFAQSNDQFVWKIINKKPVKQLVKTGLENDDSIEIISGLQENNLVVTDASKIK